MNTKEKGQQLSLSYAGTSIHRDIKNSKAVGNYL